VGKCGPASEAELDREFPTLAAARPVPPHKGEGIWVWPAFRVFPCFPWFQIFLAAYDEPASLPGIADAGPRA